MTIVIHRLETREPGFLFASDRRSSLTTAIRLQDTSIDFRPFRDHFSRQIWWLWIPILRSPSSMWLSPDYAFWVWIRICLCALRHGLFQKLASSSWRSRLPLRGSLRVKYWQNCWQIMDYADNDPFNKIAHPHPGELLCPRESQGALFYPREMLSTNNTLKCLFNSSVLWKNYFGKSLNR